MIKFVKKSMESSGNTQRWALTNRKHYQERRLKVYNLKTLKSGLKFVGLDESLPKNLGKED